MILNLNDEVVEDFLGFIRGYMCDVRTADDTRTVFCAGSATDDDGRWGIEAYNDSWDTPGWADPGESFIIPWEDIEEIEVL